LQSPAALANMLIFPTAAAAVKALRDEEIDAVIADKLAIQYANLYPEVEKSTCDLVVSRIQWRCHPMLPSLSALQTVGPELPLNNRQLAFPYKLGLNYSIGIGAALSQGVLISFTHVILHHLPSTLARLQASRHKWTRA
jgi:hypothetical protein